MTDPEVAVHNAWQPEVADPCDNHAKTVTMPNGKKFHVQAIWSNSANGHRGACVFAG